MADEENKSLLGNPQDNSAPGQRNIAAGMGDMGIQQASDAVNAENPNTDDILNSYSAIAENFNQLSMNAAEQVGDIQTSLVGNDFGATNPYMYNTYYEPNATSFASAMRKQGTQDALEAQLNKSQKDAEAALQAAKDRYSKAYDSAKKQEEQKRKVVAQGTDYSGTGLDSGDTGKEIDTFQLTDQQKAAQIQRGQLDQLEQTLKQSGTEIDYNNKAQRKIASDSIYNKYAKDNGVTYEQAKQAFKNDNTLWSNDKYGNLWTATYLSSYINNGLAPEVKGQLQKKVIEHINYIRDGANTIIDALKNKDKRDTFSIDLKSFEVKQISNPYDVRSKQVEHARTNKLGETTMKEAYDAAVSYMNGAQAEQYEYDEQGKMTALKDIQASVNEEEFNKKYKGYMEYKDGNIYFTRNKFNWGYKDGKSAGEPENLLDEYAQYATSEKIEVKETTRTMSFYEVTDSYLGIDQSTWDKLESLKTNQPDKFNYIINRSITDLAQNPFEVVTDTEKKYYVDGEWKTLDKGTIVFNVSSDAYARDDNGEIKKDDDGNPMFMDPALQAAADAVVKAEYNADGSMKEEDMKKFNESLNEYRGHLHAASMFENINEVSASNNSDMMKIVLYRQYGGKSGTDKLYIADPFNGGDSTISVGQFIKKFNDLSEDARYDMFSALNMKAAESRGYFYVKNNDGTRGVLDLKNAYGDDNIGVKGGDGYKKNMEILNEIGPQTSAALLTLLCDGLNSGSVNNDFLDNDHVDEVNKLFTDFHTAEEGTAGFLVDVLGMLGEGATRAVSAPFNLVSGLFGGWDESEDKGFFDHVFQSDIADGIADWRGEVERDIQNLTPEDDALGFDEHMKPGFKYDGNDITGRDYSQKLRTEQRANLNRLYIDTYNPEYFKYNDIDIDENGRVFDKKGNELTMLNANLYHNDDLKAFMDEIVGFGAQVGSFAFEQFLTAGISGIVKSVKGGASLAKSVHMTSNALKTAMTSSPKSALKFWLTGSLDDMAKGMTAQGMKTKITTAKDLFADLSDDALRVVEHGDDAVKAAESAVESVASKADDVARAGKEAAEKAAVKEAAEDIAKSADNVVASTADDIAENTAKKFTYEVEYNGSKAVKITSLDDAGKAIASTTMKLDELKKISQEAYKAVNGLNNGFNKTVKTINEFLKDVNQNAALGENISAKISKTIRETNWFKDYAKTVGMTDRQASKVLKEAVKQAIEATNNKVILANTLGVTTDMITAMGLSDDAVKMLTTSVGDLEYGKSILAGFRNGNGTLISSGRADKAMSLADILVDEVGKKGTLDVIKGFGEEVATNSLAHDSIGDFLQYISNNKTALSEDFINAINKDSRIREFVKDRVMDWGRDIAQNYYMPTYNEDGTVRSENLAETFVNYFTSPEEIKMGMAFDIGSTGLRKLTNLGLSQYHSGVITRAKRALDDAIAAGDSGKITKQLALVQKHAGMLDKAQRKVNNGTFKYKTADMNKLNEAHAKLDSYMDSIFSDYRSSGYSSLDIEDAISEIAEHRKSRNVLDLIGKKIDDKKLENLNNLNNYLTKNRKNAMTVRSTMIKAAGAEMTANGATLQTVFGIGSQHQVADMKTMSDAGGKAFREAYKGNGKNKGYWDEHQSVHAKRVNNENSIGDAIARYQQLTGKKVEPDMAKRVSKALDAIGTKDAKGREISFNRIAKGDVKNIVYLALSNDFYNNYYFKALGNSLYPNAGGRVSAQFRNGTAFLQDNYQKLGLKMLDNGRAVRVDYLPTQAYLGGDFDTTNLSQMGRMASDNLTSLASQSLADPHKTRDFVTTEQLLDILDGKPDEDGNFYYEVLNNETGEMEKHKINTEGGNPIYAEAMYFNSEISHSVNEFCLNLKDVVTINNKEILSNMTVSKDQLKADKAAELKKATAAYEEAMNDKKEIARKGKAARKKLEEAKANAQASASTTMPANIYNASAEDVKVLNRATTALRRMEQAIADYPEMDRALARLRSEMGGGDISRAEIINYGASKVYQAIDTLKAEGYDENFQKLATQLMIATDYKTSKADKEKAGKEIAGLIKKVKESGNKPADDARSIYAQIYYNLGLDGDGGAEAAINGFKHLSMYNKDIIELAQNTNLQANHGSTSLDLNVAMARGKSDLNGGMPMLDAIIREPQYESLMFVDGKQLSYREQVQASRDFFAQFKDIDGASEFELTKKRELSEADKGEGGEKSVAVDYFSSVLGVKGDKEKNALRQYINDVWQDFVTESYSNAEDSKVFISKLDFLQFVDENAGTELRNFFGEGNVGLRDSARGLSESFSKFERYSDIDVSKVISALDAAEDGKVTLPNGTVVDLGDADSVKRVRALLNTINDTRVVTQGSDASGRELNESFDRSGGEADIEDDNYTADASYAADKSVNSFASEAHIYASNFKDNELRDIISDRVEVSKNASREELEQAVYAISVAGKDGDPNKVFRSESNFGQESIPAPQAEAPNSSTLKVSSESKMTRSLLSKNKDKVYLFGDNIDDAKTGYVPKSTQAQIRGMDNAIGIPTKKNRGTGSGSYFTDADFDAFKEGVDNAIDNAKKSGKEIVIPSDGIGTGKAQLKERAPKCFEYLQNELDKLHSQAADAQKAGVTGIVKESDADLLKKLIDATMPENPGKEGWDRNQQFFQNQPRVQRKKTFEVSTAAKGEGRDFSALNYKGKATDSDITIKVLGKDVQVKKGQTVEDVFQNNVKKSGKNQPPAKDSIIPQGDTNATKKAYEDIWRGMLKDEDIDRLRKLSNGAELTDKFARKGGTSQAEALQNIIGGQVATNKYTKPDADAKNTSTVTKIISGGQTGVDTGGLQVGRDLGIETGGTAAPGFAREANIDSISPEHLKALGLKEIDSNTQGGKAGREFYLPRTKQNVLDSDGTVYFSTGNESAGYKATKGFADEAGKPFISNPTAAELREWMDANNIKTLNVAGNRGSKIGADETYKNVLKDALTGNTTSDADAPKAEAEYHKSLVKFANDSEVQRIISKYSQYSTMRAGQRFNSNASKDSLMKAFGVKPVDLTDTDAVSTANARSNARSTVFSSSNYETDAYTKPGYSNNTRLTKLSNTSAHPADAELYAMSPRGLKELIADNIANDADRKILLGKLDEYFPADSTKEIREAVDNLVNADMTSKNPRKANSMLYSSEASSLSDRMYSLLFPEKGSMEPDGQRIIKGVSSDSSATDFVSYNKHDRSAEYVGRATDKKFDNPALEELKNTDKSKWGELELVNQIFDVDETSGISDYTNYFSLDGKVFTLEDIVPEGDGAAVRNGAVNINLTNDEAELLRQLAGNKQTFTNDHGEPTTGNNLSASTASKSRRMKKIDDNFYKKFDSLFEATAKERRKFFSKKWQNPTRNQYFTTDVKNLPDGTAITTFTLRNKRGDAIDSVSLKTNRQRKFSKDLYDNFDLLFDATAEDKEKFFSNRWKNLAKGQYFTTDTYNLSDGTGYTFIARNNKDGKVIDSVALQTNNSRTKETVAELNAAEGKAQPSSQSNIVDVDTEAIDVENEVSKYIDQNTGKYKISDRDTLAKTRNTAVQNIVNNVAELEKQSANAKEASRKINLEVNEKYQDFVEGIVELNDKAKTVEAIDMLKADREATMRQIDAQENPSLKKFGEKKLEAIENSIKDLEQIADLDDVKLEETRKQMAAKRAERLQKAIDDAQDEVDTLRKQYNEASSRVKDAEEQGKLAKEAYAKADADAKSGTSPVARTTNGILAVGGVEGITAPNTTSLGDYIRMVEQGGDRKTLKSNTERRRQAVKDIKNGYEYKDPKKRFTGDLEKNARLEFAKYILEETRKGLPANVRNQLTADDILVDASFLSFGNHISVNDIKSNRGFGAKVSNVWDMTSEFIKTVQDKQLAAGVAQYNAYTFRNVMTQIMQHPIDGIKTAYNSFKYASSNQGVLDYFRDNSNRMMDFAVRTNDFTMIKAFDSSNMNTVDSLRKAGVIGNVAADIKEGLDAKGVKAKLKSIGNVIETITDEPTFGRWAAIFRTDMTLRNYERSLKMVDGLRLPASAFNDYGDSLALDENGRSEGMKNFAAQIAKAQTDYFFNPKEFVKSGGNVSKAFKTMDDLDEMNYLLVQQGLGRNPSLIDNMSNFFFALNYKLQMGLHPFTGAASILNGLNPKNLKMSANIKFGKGLNAGDLDRLMGRAASAGVRNQVYSMVAIAALAYAWNKSIGAPTAKSDINGGFWGWMSNIQDMGKFYLPGQDGKFDYQGKGVNIDTMQSIFTLPNSVTKAFGKATGNIETNVNTQYNSLLNGIGLNSTGINNNPLARTVRAFNDEIIGGNLLSVFGSVWELYHNSTYFGNNIWEQKELPNGEKNLNYNPLRNGIAITCHILNLDAMLDSRGSNRWVKGRNLREDMGWIGQTIYDMGGYYNYDENGDPIVYEGGYAGVNQDKTGTVLGSGILQHEYMEALGNALDNGDWALALVGALELPVKTRSYSGRARTALNNEVQNGLRDAKQTYDMAVKAANGDSAKIDAAYAEYATTAVGVVQDWYNKYEPALKDNPNLIASSVEILTAFMAGEYDDNLGFRQNVYWKIREELRLAAGDELMYNKSSVDEMVEDGMSVEEATKVWEKHHDAYMDALNDEYEARKAIQEAYNGDPDKYSFMKGIKLWSDDDTENWLYRAKNREAEARITAEKVISEIQSKLNSKVGDFKNYAEYKKYTEEMIAQQTSTKKKAAIANKYNENVTDILSPYIEMYGATMLMNLKDNNYNAVESLFKEYIIIPADQNYTKSKTPYTSYLRDMFKVGYRKKDNLPSDGIVDKWLTNVSNALKHGNTASAESILSQSIEAYARGDVHMSEADYNRIMKLKAMISAKGIQSYRYGVKQKEVK